MLRYRTFVLSLAAAAVAVSGLGVAGSQAAVGIQPYTSCSSSSACTSVTNNGSGPATAALSIGGNGSTSTTNFNSTSASKFAAGIFGVDGSSKGTFDFGVQGTSARGTGVHGSSKSGTGVSGLSASGAGVNGASKNGSGVNGTSTNGAGVSGFSNSIGMQAASSGVGGVGIEAIASVSSANGTGVLAYATGTNGTGVSATGGSIGVQAYGGSSAAVQANGSGADLFDGITNGSQVFGVDQYGDVTSSNQMSANVIFASTGSAEAIEGDSPSSGIVGRQTSSDALGGAVEGFGAGGLIYQGINSADNTVFTVDNSGNVELAGHMAVSGPCASGCGSTAGASTRVVSYVPRESQPTLEDFGEARLIGGTAYVKLDAAFVNVIDGRSAYLVFITPEGDSRGLYVNQETPAGFAVHENEGGHASIAFGYRIVAKPYGDASPRLPVVTLRRSIPPVHARRTFPPTTKHG